MQTDMVNSFKLDLAEVRGNYFGTRRKDALQGRKNSFISMFEASSFGLDTYHTLVPYGGMSALFVCHKGTNKSRVRLGKLLP